MTLPLFPLPKGSHTGARSVGGWICSSYFGGRKDPITGRPGNHGGMDLVAPSRTPMYAVKSGRVQQSFDPSGGGLWSGLYADDGSYYGYGHAAAYASGVNGSHVEAGTLIAYVGTTGHSTGNHLHFARRAPGQYAYSDPFDELNDAAVNGRFVGAHPPHTNHPMDNKCKPGAGEDIMHFLGTDPRDGKVYEIDGLFKRHIESPELVEIIHTNAGIENRGKIAAQIIDTRQDVNA